MNLHGPEVDMPEDIEPARQQAEQEAGAEEWSADFLFEALEIRWHAPQLADLLERVSKLHIASLSSLRERKDAEVAVMRDKLIGIKTRADAMADSPDVWVIRNTAYSALATDSGKALLQERDSLRERLEKAERERGDMKRRMQLALDNLQMSNVVRAKQVLAVT
jgi:hypothetical protein